IICTLLTHLTTIESEIEFWKALSKEHDLKLSDFLTLSKRRVHSKIELADGIKLTLLNHKCDTLKGFAVEITKTANEVASNALADINVYDFYHMVLKSSEEEGIWEAQTLFRIHNIFQELESQKLALESENRRVLNENISLLRGLMGKEKLETTNISWEIRRKELFYDESLNKLNLPLQNGDIFRFEQNSKYYILLTQPCDLMIRKSGNRKQKVGILAEIVYETPKETEKDSYKPIPYFNSGTKSSAFVKFKETISIDLDILDLSIYNDNGAAIFNSGIDLSIYHNPLQKRFVIIKEKMEQKKLKCAELKDIVEKSDIDTPKKAELIDAVLFQAFNVDKNLINVEFKESEIVFNIVRKGTYRNPFSDLLLDDYSYYLSRTGAEHDFSMVEVENTVPKKELVTVSN
ncbi:hypothetical protein V7111_26505, partial [Neobacillus niacini]|uniref:hypothetical protein n=1 Tax=Neobacillus niacini TaxID=86668 RepID=UPI003002AED9